MRLLRWLRNLYHACHRPDPAEFRYRADFAWECPVCGVGWYPWRTSDDGPLEWRRLW